MDRPLAPEFVRQRRRRRTVGAAAGVSLAGFALLWGPGLIRPTVSRDRIRTARVDRGAIEAVITATGHVVPEVEQVVSSPVDARVLRILRRAGEPVAPGEPIVELDLSASQVALAKLDQDLALKRNQQEKTRLDLQAKLAEVQAKWDVKKLQLEGYRAQLRRHRDLHAQGLLSQEALQQSELAEAQAAVELRQLEAERASAQQSTRAQLAGVALEAAQLSRERDEARRQLLLATTRADRNGVVTWTVTEEGAAVRKGDLLARLADLGSFRVEATVSDVHAQRLVPGLPVEVRVAEGQGLAGTVATVRPAIANGSVSFAVALRERSSPRLRTNLRVDVLVIVGRKDDALRLKRGPFANGEGQQQVFVVQGDRAVRTPVRLGLSSFDQFEVVSGLQEGDEAVISDMSAYQHVKQVALR
ncbi:MAG TPA: HlyD family efflux transporter periplasmic adaptor subunit [Vicinamibacteria bacterium]|jgi:HlyD family secretion protein